LKEPTTILSKSVSKEQTHPTTLSKSSLKEVTQTTNGGKSSLTEVTPPLTQTTHLLKSSLKETTPPQQSTSLPGKTQSLVGSTLPNENKTPTTDHESNWTVKSTIVTTYSQGVGDRSEPTVVSKVVSESSASSSNNIPTTTSIKQVKDSKDLSESKITGNGTSVRGAAPSTTATSNGNRVNK